ncbi:protein sel-1 3, partial [Biomphalaria glabrata]
NEDMYVDDTFGLWAIGGLDWNMGSFVGYMGRVVYYRQRVLQPHQMSLPDPYHPMFELHLTRKREKCETFLNWLDTAVDVYQKYRRYVLDNRPDVCQYDPYQFFAKFLTSSEDPQTCPMKRPFNLRNHRHISRQLQKVVGTMDLSKNFLHGDLEAYSRSSKSNESRAAFMAISVGLIENATQIVSDRGLRHASKVVQLFKQAACLGNDDAMYYLAVMMNNGVGCPLDELQ